MMERVVAGAGMVLFVGATVVWIAIALDAPTLGDQITAVFVAALSATCAAVCVSGLWRGE